MSAIDSGHHGACVARRTKRLWTDDEKRSICFQTPAVGEARFLPVEIVAEAKGSFGAPITDNHIEIELVGGHRLRISGNYDPEALARLMRGLTACSRS